MKTTKMMAIVAVLVFGMTFGLGGMAQAVSIDTVTVGNPGNTADGTGYGAVAYEYDIGKYEVTASQYAAFLNAVAATDTYALYNTLMANTSTGTGTGSGISRTGSSGSYIYSVTSGFENRPVVRVSWYDTLRFANWLTNGQPTGAQDAGTTESGSYTFDGATTVTSMPDHAALAAGTTAYWLLTSEDEWYKAAYHDKSAGLAATYFEFPTGSNAAPTAEAPAGGSNSANYSSAVGTTTDVGAYTASDSPYGTFDQAGNVWEWNEAWIDPKRGYRGGFFANSDLMLRASEPRSTDPSSEVYFLGFRVSAVGVPVPEPAGLGLVGLALLAIRRKRS